MLGEWLSHASRYGEHAIGLMVRRSRTELLETIERSKQIYGPLNWKYNEVEHLWRGPDGSRLRFAYLERDADADRYQGHSYTRLYVEEIGNFPTPAPILKLMATLRSGAGVPVGMRATGNPGGCGHHWVKARYIDPAPHGNEIIRDPLTHLERVFIPSRVDNNKHIDIAAYKQRLRGSGPAELVRAWLDGDWSVTLGAFFDCWSDKRHVIDPFPIPNEWMRFRSMDWGSASPFSVGWWAVVQDDYPLMGEQGTRILPRGCMVRYREWYGMKPGQPNVGIKLHAGMVGSIIEQKERDEPISYGVLDPSAFAEDGGPSLAERIAAGSEGKVWFRRADNTRIAARGAMGGWDQMRARLVGDKEGRPLIVTFATCIDSIRTIPFLQHDPDRLEDVMCWVAGTMVSTPDGDRPIETIRSGDLVNTPIGPRQVLKSHLSGVSGTAWVEMSNGVRLEGTPNHKIYIRGKGLVALENVTQRDIPGEAMLTRRIITWQRKASYIAALFTHAMMGVSTTIQTVRPWRAAARAFIDRFGLMPAMKFQPAGMSITSMTTTTITTFPILNASQRENTRPITQRNAISAARRLSLPGEQAGKERPSHAQAPSRCGSGHQSANLRAAIVVNLLKRDTLCKNIALIAAPILRAVNRLQRLARFAAIFSGRANIKRKKSEPAHITAVGHSDAATQVYNLTVAEAHLFYANGVLSSNTDSEDHAADEWRYACMSRPYVSTIEKPDQRELSGYKLMRDSVRPGDWVTYGLMVGACLTEFANSLPTIL